MKYSIVVPVYTVEKYLRQCLDSVLGQTFTDFELILVDDGAPDGSPAICDEYALKDTRVKVIHKPNGGAADARNVGILAAQGEYIGFIDGDDFWKHEEVLGKIYDILCKKNYDVVQFQAQRYYQESGKIADKHALNENITEPSSEKYICSLIQKGNLHISAWSMVIKREFLLSNQLFFKKGIKAEDIEWGIRLFALLPDIIAIPDIFYMYREHTEAITKNIDYKHLRDYYNIIVDSTILAENLSGDIRSSLLSYIMYQLTIAVGLCCKSVIEKEDRKQLLKGLKQQAKNRLNKYTLYPHGKQIATIYKLFGFSIFAYIMGFYLKHRKR